MWTGRSRATRADSPWRVRWTRARRTVDKRRRFMSSTADKRIIDRTSGLTETGAKEATTDRLRPISGHDRSSTPPHSPQGSSLSGGDVRMWRTLNPRPSRAIRDMRRVRRGARARRWRGPSHGDRVGRSRTFLLSEGEASSLARGPLLPVHAPRARERARGLPSEAGGPGGDLPARGGPPRGGAAEDHPLPSARRSRSVSSKHEAPSRHEGGGG